MKTIRYIASLLMIISGVLHALPIILTPQDSNAVPMLVFGIVYLTIGILLFLNLKIAPVLGIIFPLIGIGAGLFVIGPANLDAMLIFLFAIDAVVVLCCTILILKKTK